MTSYLEYVPTPKNSEKVVKYKEELKLIWNTTKELYNKGTPYDRESYDILCRFFDKFICKQFIYLDLRTFVEFWILIQKGLNHDDILMRKRSTFLLKKAVAMSTEHQSSAKSTNWTNYFFWDSQFNNQLIKLWNTFFLVYETLDEFNLHLIEVCLFTLFFY